MGCSAGGHLAASLGINWNQPIITQYFQRQDPVSYTHLPRASSFQIRYTKDGWTETLDAGTRGDALVYEVRDMEAAVSGTAKNTTLDISSDVVALMDEVRKQWGMRYPFEDEAV